ncbi:MAG: hypothetical protein COA78_26530 [Blastopirellula sp.]|nr:MAG: hypothetical protein COA78_26530 [Blastopirellula sp.]
MPTVAVNVVVGHLVVGRSGPSVSLPGFTEIGQSQMTLCVPSDDKLFSPPDAGNLHVRWDEGGGQQPASTLLPL